MVLEILNNTLHFIYTYIFNESIRVQRLSLLSLFDNVYAVCVVVCVEKSQNVKIGHIKISCKHRIMIQASFISNTVPIKSRQLKKEFEAFLSHIIDGLSNSYNN